MQYLKRSTIILLLIAIISSGFACKWNPFQKEKSLYKPVTLEYWGVWDTPEQIKPLIEAYQSTHPTIKINYKNFRYEEYERKLLEAWADDRGPDIFAIPVAWLKEYQSRLEPMPASHKIPVYELQGTIKKEAVTVLKEFKGLTANDVKTRYAPIVYENIILDDKIYGLPYSLDTLATFYNLDLLNQAGIPEPIKDFFDLVDQTPQLTRANSDNKIVQSAVALGGTQNIPRFFDIFSSIMLQNGVQAKGNRFNPLADKDSATRLAQTFSFYTDFARSGKASYSWSDDLDNAFEMFASGRLVYYFGYSYDAENLRKRGVSFDWGITNFPQTRGAEGTKYYANYWVSVVAKKSKNKGPAWNFVQSTANAELAPTYLTANKRPTALRALLNDQLEDEDVSVFASQVLTADNWYNGYDADSAEKYLADVIDALVRGDIVLDKGGSTLGLFVNQINQTYKNPNE